MGCWSRTSFHLVVALVLALGSAVGCGGGSNQGGGAGRGGSSGAAGVTGSAGTAGGAGTTGNAGTAGGAGATGSAGTTGGAGAMGSAGTTGTAGAGGGAGTTGAAGRGGTGGGAAGTGGGAAGTGGNTGPGGSTGSGMPLAKCRDHSDCAVGSWCLGSAGLTTTFGHCFPEGSGGGTCRATGARCDTGYSCAQFITNGNPALGAVGYCVPAAAVGAACGYAAGACPTGSACINSICVADGAMDRPCRSTAPRCDQGLGCSTNATCRPLGTNGACSTTLGCPDGSSCLSSVCAVDGANGSVCRAASPQCDAGLACNLSSRCAPGAAEGEACSANAAPCLPPLGCSPVTRLCAPLGSLEGLCRPGAGCDVDLRCDANNTCRPAAQVTPEGAACVSATPCEYQTECNLQVATPVCARLGMLNGPCRNSSPPCDTGLYCEGRFCRTQLPAGTACNAVVNPGCATGLSCTNYGSAMSCRANGSEGGSCRQASSAVPVCNAGLACRSGLCWPATITVGMSCTVNGSVDCVPGSTCVNNVCVATGQIGGLCQTSDPDGACAALLGCSSAGRCVSGLGDGATCTPLIGTTVCARPNICVTSGGQSTCRERGYTESTVAVGFVDACATGIHVGLTTPTSSALPRVDGISAMAINLPFPFEFWGTSYSQVWPSVKGVLLFRAFTSTLPGVGNGYLPYDAAGPLAAPFWDDIYLGDPPGSDICITSDGAAPNRRFIVQWSHAHRLARPSVDLDFQVVLNETTHAIDFVYRTLSPASGQDAPWADGGRAAIGLQSGYSGKAIVHQGKVSTASAIRFSPR